MYITRMSTPIRTASRNSEHLIPPYSLQLNPQENLWGRNPEKIFKNDVLKSMDDVNAKLDEAAFYTERNPTLVKSITSFPYIAKSL
jgi:hypothetical protein